MLKPRPAGPLVRLTLLGWRMSSSSEMDLGTLYCGLYGSICVNVGEGLISNGYWLSTWPPRVRAATKNLKNRNQKWLWLK